MKIASSCQLLLKSSVAPFKILHKTLGAGSIKITLPANIFKRIELNYKVRFICKCLSFTYPSSFIERTPGFWRRDRNCFEWIWDLYHRSSRNPIKLFTKTWPIQTSSSSTAVSKATWWAFLSSPRYLQSTAIWTFVCSIKETMVNPGPAGPSHQADVAHLTHKSTVEGLFSGCV